MFKYIEKLHKQPEVVRKQVGLGVALSVTAIIFVVWITTLNVRVDDNQSVTGVRAIGSIAAPLHTLSEGIKETTSGVRESLAELNAVLGEEE